MEPPLCGEANISCLAELSRSVRRKFKINFQAFTRGMSDAMNFKHSCAACA